MVQVAAQVVAGATYMHTQKHTHTHHYFDQKKADKNVSCADLRSKKQEMVGLLTPNVVVTDLSSFLSSILLCGRRRRKWEMKVTLSKKTTGSSGLKLL